MSEFNLVLFANLHIFILYAHILHGVLSYNLHESQIYLSDNL